MYLKLMFLDIENRLWLPRWGRVREGMEWEFGMSRYRLLHVKRKNNKVILYGTDNYIWYPMVNHRRLEIYRKMNTFV